MKLHELTYRLYGDDRLTGKLRNVSRAGDKVDRSLGRASGKMMIFKKSMRNAATEIPGLNSGLRLLSNPIIAFGALATGAAIGLNKMTNEAIQFNTTFRELKNLNLDKTAMDLGFLQNSILQTSFNKGFDPGQTSKAFYDIQSVTGKYGNEVKKIVETEGRFAEVMQANFNLWIESSGKAMANYGFGADKLKEFNKSAYATVKLGSITFDQLARVQSAYAGAAAAAHQSFNASNTLMTLFTIKTKSAEEAATLTKSAFTDLFKPATIKAFAKAGIKMYDPITKKAKQVNKLILELNKKFMNQVNDKQLDALRNQFTGSEGLLSLLQVAADRSGNLKRTLEDIDKLKFNYAKALANANKDIAVQTNRLQNKIKAMNIKIGIELLPLKNSWTQFKLEFLEKFSAWWKGREQVLKEITDQNVFNIGEKYRTQLSVADKMPQEKFNAIINELQNKVALEKKVMANYKYPNNMTGYLDYSNDNHLSLKTGILDVKDFYKRHWAFKDAYKNLISQFHEFRNDPNVNPYRTASTDNGGSNDANSGIQSGLSAVTGGGTQMKSITVNIDKLVERLIIETTKLEESENDIEQRITELLIRSIAGAEQIIAS